MSARKVQPLPAPADNSLIRDIVAAEPRATFRFCGFCGDPCVGPTCRAHSDLPARERASWTTNGDQGSDLESASALVAEEVSLRA